MWNGSDGSEGLTEIEAGRRELGISAQDVWIGYFTVGGNGSLADIEGWLAGDTVLPRMEHNMLAQALNDVFTDRGLNHPIRYNEPS